jgi:ankyrin repeat protein
LKERRYSVDLLGVTRIGRWGRRGAVLVLGVSAVALAAAAFPPLRARVALWRRGAPVLNDAAALHTASRADDVETLGLLRAAGADLTALDADGDTPLQAAAAAGAPHAAAFLVAQGARVDDVRQGRTPLALALERGHLEVAHVLLQHGADAMAPIGSESRPALLHAAQTGDLRTMNLLLGFGVRPDLNDPDGVPVLAHAVARNDESITRALLEAGATPDVDAPAPHRSLLEQAIRDGGPGVVDLLLAHGANPGVLSREGQPLLPLAVALGRVDVAEALLDAGTNVNTLLVSPVSEEFLALLPGRYARFHLTRDEGLTPLMVAVLRGDLELTKLLMKRGASLGPTRGQVKYPLGMAADRRNIPMMQVLLGRDPAEAARTRHIVVSIGQQQATLYENDEPTLRTRVSTGRKGFPTPRGEYVITDKRRHWESTIYDGAEMPYFMRLSGSDIGMHEGVVPRGRASHGCIRLPSAAARTLYARMRLGDPVTVGP